jgi:K+-sensing histidine kinase KdpD
MFINLLENAAEAMEHQGRIWIDTQYNAAAQRIRISVADEGPGITPADKSLLFVPYFSRKKSGTGLGLAIVQRIVSDHDGKIRVEDNLPRGSRFLIELPVAASSFRTRSTAEEVDAGNVKSSGQKLTVKERLDQREAPKRPASSERNER